jgi:threonine synthase
VDDICHTDVEIPARLAAFMQGQKQSIPMPNDFQAFKQFLMEQ